MGKNKNENKNKGEVKIPETVKEFASLKWKKYKKKNEEYYSSKKELKEGYYYDLLPMLPDTIEYLVKYGYVDDEKIQNVKSDAFTKFVDPKFIKFLSDYLKNGDDIENIKWFPVLISEMLKRADQRNSELLAEDPNSKLYDMSDLSDLSKQILKKKLKKMEKAGIDANLAFDCLSVIPKDDILESTSKGYRIRMVNNVMYEHAKTKAVPYGTVIDILVKEDYYSWFALFALLERKEKFGSLTDSQKTLYLDISNWTFDVMEHKLSNNELIDLMNAYIKNCRRDDASGRGGNRRYALSTLSADDYPRIAALVQKMISNDDSVKKYL